MTTFYVSFPVGDAERRDCYTTIDAESDHAARVQIIARYGRDGFCSTYLTPDAIGVEKYGLHEIPFGK